VPHTSHANSTADCRYFRPGCPTALPWWQANKPDLILYQCDRKTPAWECFKGEGCRHDSVPLDLSNPGTLDFQMQAAVLPAAKAGYNALALDNYQLINSWGACGSFSGPNGSWVQLFNATDQEDPRYAATVLDWTRRAVPRIHDAGLLVIVNRFNPTFTPQNLAVANLTDGLLAEPGFLVWSPRPGPGYKTGPGEVHSTTVPPPKTTPATFDAQVAFVRHLQRHGKGFYAINEWGEGPDYGLNPSRQPHNISDPVRDRAVRQFAVASFMSECRNGRLGPLTVVATLTRLVSANSDQRSPLWFVPLVRPVLRGSGDRQFEPLAGVLGASGPSVGRTREGQSDGGVDSRIFQSAVLGQSREQQPACTTPSRPQLHGPVWRAGAWRRSHAGCSERFGVAAAQPRMNS